MGYVLRTDKLSSPHYWAGITHGNVGMVHAISPIVWNAWQIEDKDEAERVLKELGDDWSISEVSSPQASRSLRRKR